MILGIWHNFNLRYNGKGCPPTYISSVVKFRNLKIHNALNITPIFLKLWIFTNLNMVIPVVVLVFDFDFGSAGQ
jgi:hypothetical protein